MRTNESITRYMLKNSGVLSGVVPQELSLRSSLSGVVSGARASGRLQEDLSLKISGVMSKIKMYW